MTALPSSCDLAAAHACGPGETTRHPRLVLAATVLASSLAFVDGSVVNVGLPAIGKSFAADPAALQWVINAYLLPLSALLLLGGAAGDRYGRRRLLVAGVTLFALASLACAWAPSLVLLLAGRAAQGAAAAMVLPNSLAILGGAFTDEAKGRAIGTWAAAGAVAGAVGPVLGGWLIDTVDWRAIFLLNLPLAAGAVLLALRAVPPDKPDADQPLDWRGGVLATLSLGLITWALTLGAGEAGWTVVTLGGVAAGVALFVAFLGVEHRRGERAMMPLAMFASRDFIGLTLLTLTLYGALGGMMVLVPYLLIETAGYSGTAAGAALLPFPLILAVLSPLAGGLVARVGARMPLGLGPLVVAAGFLLALRIGPAADYWTEVLPCIAVIALGMSAAVAPLTTAVLTSVEPSHTGSASGFNSAVARAGGLVATALLGGVLVARGEALLAPFHLAMAVGAGACVAASASALLLISGGADREAGRRP